ncbi:MAG: DUF4831 family protein [Bacteroidales bacterium]|jgi:hypothetical protein|nr:DUF4831 family protein [Bacteroidales bacterium]
MQKFVYQLIKRILQGCGIVVALVWVASCVSVKNETAVAPYSPAVMNNSALVYGLPQTRLYFEVELVKTRIKKGPYAEYAARMLGLQDVPMKDSERWQLGYVHIYDKAEVDNKQLYALSFRNYPQILDKLMRFTKEGLILDVSADNILMNSQTFGKNNEDFHFMNTAITTTVVEKVDTFYKTILTDTAFVRIPVLQRKVMGKTAEEQAREAANQIFGIRQGRIDIITGNTDHNPDGNAMKLVLEALDNQEEQLLSLFIGAKVESRYVHTYSVLPEKADISDPLFYFSDKTGIVSGNSADATKVWYRIGKANAPASVHVEHQAANIVYYRIPQVVEVSAGVAGSTLVGKQKSIYQLGNLVSFPLLPQKK